MESTPYQMVSVHNHPRIPLPSEDDLTAHHLSKYEKSIIGAHNGRLLVYCVNKDIDFEFLKNSL